MTLFAAPQRRLLTTALLAGIAATFTLTAAAEPGAAGQRDPEKPFYLDTVVIKGKRDKYGERKVRSSTKMDMLVRDTPQAISVVTDQLIKDQDMDGLDDVVRYMPGISMAQGEGNRDTIVVRGVTSTADFFTDGVRDDTQYIRDVYNVQRVEGLKGANALVFGRGGGGGVINRVSKVADGADHSAASLTFGSNDRRRATGDLGAMIGDSWSARLPFMIENSNSYRDGMYIHRFGFNPSVTYQGERTSATLAVEMFQDQRAADRGVPSFNGKPLETDPSQFFGDPSRSPVQATVRSGTLTVDHELNQRASVRNVLRYTEYDKFYQNVFPSTYNAATGRVTLGAYNQATQRRNWFNQTDMLLNFTTGAIKHDLLVGTEFGRQDTSNMRMTGTFLDGNSVPLSDSIHRGRITWAQSATDSANRGQADIAAAYVQDLMTLSKQWQLIVGARHDRFKMDFTNLRNGQRLQQSNSEWSPRVGLVYKPIEPVSVYASYSKTFLPRSGDQLSSLSLTTAALDPETYENREIGFKWDLRRDLSLSTAVYQMDRRNVAVVDPVDPTKMILVDGQRNKGVEVSLAGRFSPKWNVIGAYAYQTGEDLTTGMDLAQLSRNTFSLWNRYDFTPKFGLGLGAMYRSSFYAARDLAVTLPSYTRFDGAAYYRFNKKLGVQLNVENLLDKKYWASAHSNNNITPGSPRAYNVTLSYGF